MNYFILGLVLSAVFLYEMASKKTEDKPEGPFSDKDCNDTYNKLPPLQQNLIKAAIKTGSKNNINLLAHNVRKDYPDMAKCLDTIAASLGIKEGLNEDGVVIPKIDIIDIPKIDIIDIPIPGLEKWTARAAECKHISGPGNKVYDSFFVREGEPRGTGLVERLGPLLGRIVTIATYDSAYVAKHPLPEVGKQIVLDIPAGIVDCK